MIFKVENMMRIINKLKKLNWVSATPGGIIGLVFGFVANDMLFSITSGLWSISEGAPWIAIYAVYIVPVLCGLIYGLKSVGYGILMGFCYCDC